jgi:hypothetical protein
VKLLRSTLHLLIVTFIFCELFIAPATGDNIFAPEYLWARKIADKKDPVDIANTHLGIPYRDDGALDDKGHFTTFAHPEEILDSPGLNCSGLVVSVCRYLFNKNWTIAQVMRDPQGNSGSNSALGKDWDFGWDLILNLTEGRSRKLLSPDGSGHAPGNIDGLNSRGFDLLDRAAWQAVLAQMQPGRVYLGSISKPTKKPGYKILHYHVVLILPDSKHGIWLYHATHRSNVHRMDINTPQGLNRFFSQFGGQKGEIKKILLLEVLPTQIDPPPTHTAAGTGTGSESGRMAFSEDLMQLTKGSLATRNPSHEEMGTPPAKERENIQIAESSEKLIPPEIPAQSALPPKPNSPDLVINHLAGKVFKMFPDLVTHIPRFSGDTKDGIKFGFRNLGETPREVEIQLSGPGLVSQYKGRISPDARTVEIIYPRDFAKGEAGPLRVGQYREEIKVGGTPWAVNIFEVVKPREATPKIVRVNAPSTVKSGATFTVRIDAENKGAESDYGGITVSAPDTSGLKIVSAKPGKLFGPGSTVLAVTTDRIRTKVPMAERWIELWGENKSYDMTVQIQAGRPGTYPLYVRCALRGVNVKSSVVLMDPSSSENVDQQGFPVYVYKIRVD